MDDKILSISNVSKKYHYSDFFVFDGLSLCVFANEKISLLIDSQSGKTTLCKLILGLEKPTCGKIFFDTADATTIPPQKKSIAYLPKNLLLFENKTVLFNLAFPLKIRKVEKSVRVGIASAEAERFGIQNLLHTKVKKLSFSQKLKVALARLQIRNAKVLLIDSLLDVCEGDDWKLLQDFLQNYSQTVVVLTANSKNAIGRTLVVSDGKVVYEGSADGAKEFQKNLLWLASSYEAKEKQ